MDASVCKGRRLEGFESWGIQAGDPGDPGDSEACAGLATWRGCAPRTPATAGLACSEKGE